jgi:hypothetical protein
MDYDPSALERTVEQFRRELWRSVTADAVVERTKAEGASAVGEGASLERAIPPWLNPWARMRFSRHAKNAMRLYGISVADIEAATKLPPVLVSGDESGNWRVSGRDVRGRAIIVVIAGDDATFVITTFPDD